MKRLLKGFFLIVLAGCLGMVSLQAQERIHSLSLKQYEIENAIHESLRNYLQPKDYVLKVRLEGSRVSEQPRQTNNRAAVQAQGGGLPGFEPETETVAPGITELVGETYWQITRMKIDLVMHKEISTSLNTFIREMIPVLSGLNTGRGDQFNFIPIVPKPLEKKVQAKKDTTENGENTDELALPQEGESDYATSNAGQADGREKWYDFSLIEWILIGAIFFFLILFLWMMLRHRKLNQSYRHLQEEWENSDDENAELEKEKILEEIQNARRERLEKQQEQVETALTRDSNEKLSQQVITDLLSRKEWTKSFLDEYGADKSGVEKLTNLIAVLGPVSSRKLFADTMGKERYLEVEEESKDIELNYKDENELLKEVRSFLFAQRLQAPEVIDDDPFAFLKKMTANQAGFLVKDEAAKIKAIVISRLESEDATMVISKLPKEERIQVVMQLGKMEELPLELIEKVAYDLAEKAQNVPDDATVAFSGVDMVVDVLSHADSKTRRELVNKLRTSDQELSNRVEDKFFLFESIPVVPSDILARVVRALPPADVMTAISGADKTLQEKVILCFPENSRQTLVSTLKSQKPHPKEIKEKRRLIVKGMQDLARDNIVDLREITREWETQS